MQGTFIVLEGPDGSGTTSHSQWLAESLRKQGQDVLLTAEPTDGHIGTYIRQQLAEKTIPSPAALQLLFCADRAVHVDTVIIPALAAGKTIVCDRYSPSTIIYGHASGLDPIWLEEVNSRFPVPNALIYLLPPFETCMERIGSRGESDVFEKNEFQKRVHELYVELTAGHPFVIDSSGSKGDTATKVLDAVKKSIG
jgi:dTMP kinase